MMVARNLRFVEVVARLNESLDGCHKRLDDLDDMALKILEGTEPYTEPQQAMIGLIEACEAQQSKEVRRLNKRIHGYEHRRLYGG